MILREAMQQYFKLDWLCHRDVKRYIRHHLEAGILKGIHPERGVATAREWVSRHSNYTRHKLAAALVERSLAKTSSKDGLLSKCAGRLSGFDAPSGLMTNE